MDICKKTDYHHQEFVSWALNRPTKSGFLQRRKKKKTHTHITTSSREEAQRSCDVFFFLLFIARPIELFHRNMSYSVGEMGKDLYRKREGLKRHFIIYENTRKCIFPASVF